MGAGRCCVVYKAVAVRDTSLVALKCFRRGPSYEGAVQRESFILERMAGTAANIVTCYAVLTYRGYTFFVLELLQDNIRQVRGITGCKFSPVLSLYLVFLLDNIQE